MAQPVAGRRRAPRGRGGGEGVPAASPTPPPPATPDVADVYREVQDSPEFQLVRARYRRFVAPACAGFLAWYLGYVLLAVYAPGLMGTQIIGPVNLAMLAFFGQFAVAAAITAEYARDAARNRDRTALELRWETQERTR